MYNYIVKINVLAKPKSKKEYVQKVDETHFIVAVKEPAFRGKANQAIVCSLAEYFHIKKSNVIMLSAEKSKNKVFDIKQK